MLATRQDNRITRLASRPGRGWRDHAAGWLFCTPAGVLVIIFLVVPIALALWVSLSNWDGIGSPLSSGVHYVGASNYKAILTQPGLSQQNFGESLRNNFYYVLLVVPCQTALALALAIFVSRRKLLGRGFFRTSYYFPSVTSSVSIAIIFQFLFSSSGAVNSILGFIGIHGPQWFNDPSGVIHIVLRAVGIRHGPALLANHGLLGVSWWDWMAGPSVAMVALIILAIWTTSGTFMLIFLPALYNISEQIEDAAAVDGASAWQKFWRITVPLVRPTLFLVLTLGVIGTWQVFDSVFLISQGNPAGTTLTPAFLAYQASFSDQQWGQGAAIAFILFVLIVVLAGAQRWLLRERDRSGAARRRNPLRRLRSRPRTVGTAALVPGAGGEG